MFLHLKGCISSVLQFKSIKDKLSVLSHLFVFSNIALALIAVSGVYITSRELLLTENTAYNLLVFFSVLAIYLYDKLDPVLSKADRDSKPERSSFIHEQRPALLVIITASIIISFFLFSRISPGSMVVLLVAALITALYLKLQTLLASLSESIPLLTLSKPLVLSLVWSMATVLGPAINSNLGNIQLWALFFIRMQYYMANSVIFDFRDYRSDRVSPKLNIFFHVSESTMPRALQLCAIYFTLTVAFFVAFIYFSNVPWIFVFELLPMLFFTAVLFWQSTSTKPLLRSELQYMVLIDGALLLNLPILFFI